MKKMILALVALALCSTAALAQNFEGTFTQAKTLKVSGRVIKSEGTITFTAPDQLAMLYTKPEGDYFIVDGPLVRMDMRGVSADIDTRKNELVATQRSALLNSIAGKYEQVAEDMNATCTVREKNGQKHVEIKARKVLNKGYSGMELDYDKNGRITRMVLEEFGGISTEYILNAK